MSHGPECVYREYRDMEHGWVVRGDIRREEVRAAVVLTAEVSTEELREHCRSLIAGYKVPRAIEVLDALPRTGSGKIAKRLLRPQS